MDFIYKSLLAIVLVIIVVIHLKGVSSQTDTDPDTDKILINEVRAGKAYKFRKFLCAPGYYLSGQPLQYFLERVSGFKKWKSLGSCSDVKSVDKCGTEPKLANANVVYDDNKAGTHGVIYCNSGFVLSGQPIATCGGDGKWIYYGACHTRVSNNAEDVENYEDKICGVPPVVRNGDLDAKTTQASQTVFKVHCHSNAELEGLEYISCDHAMGRWNKPGKCVSEDNEMVVTTGTPSTPPTTTVPQTTATTREPRNRCCRNKKQSEEIVAEAKAGNRRRVKRLLNSGSDPNSVDDNEWTAVMWAAFLGNEGIMHDLVACCVNVNAANRVGTTALMLASTVDSSRNTRTLLRKGADIDAQNQYQSTALHFAVQHNMLQNTRILLEKGASEKADDDGLTALAAAVREKNRELTEILLDADFNVNSQDLNGETPLMSAAKRGYLEIVDLILTKSSESIRLNIRNNKGQTAVDVAKMFGHFELAKRIEDFGREN